MGDPRESVKARIGIFFLSFGVNVFAGIENSLYNLALGLIENSVDVHVYSGCLSGTEDKIEDISIFRSQLLPSILPKGDDTVRSVFAQNSSSIAAEIMEFLRDRTITHLYVCDPLWGIVQPTGVWKYINSPMMLSLHVLNTRDLLYQAGDIPYSLYTVVSDPLKKQIQKTHVNLKNLQVVPNSVDISYFRRSLSQDETSTNIPIIFCNARISPEKGIIYLVHSFPSIIKVFPKAELWLCGGEFSFGDPRPYVLEVWKAIQDLEITKNVRVLPKLEWSEIPYIFHQSTLVVIPSLQETFGRAALEAMACGKPLVVTNAGNLPNLVENAGLIVESGSVTALTDGILKVLRDKDLMNAHSSHGPFIAAKYSNKNVAYKLLQYMGIG